MYTVLSLMISACQTTKTPAGSAPEAVDNSRNAIDWTGTYRGTLPCADCPGIAYELTLSEDDTYILKIQYLERSDSVHTESGKLTWDSSGGRITLAGRDEQFQVGENQLFHLDTEGNRIEGPLAAHYVLTKANHKTANGLVDRYWKLIEARGESVSTENTQREPFIRLIEAENRLEANGGCNGIGGTYTLSEPNRIAFSQLISTMMACDNMDIENNLKWALETADSYHVSGDTLQLFKARMAPLAKFIAVKK